MFIQSIKEIQNTTRSKTQSDIKNVAVITNPK